MRTHSGATISISVSVSPQGPCLVDSLGHSTQLFIARFLSSLYSFYPTGEVSAPSCRRTVTGFLLLILHPPERRVHLPRDWGVCLYMMYVVAFMFSKWAINCHPLFVEG